MDHSIRLIAEYYNPKTGKVVDSKILRSDDVKNPVSIKELGYLHSEQIDLIQSIQDFKIKHEAVLINQISHCPKCGKKPSSTGIHASNFHAALTDHKVNVQRKSCHCGWSSPYSVAGIYGSSSHPDLVEKQVIQGSENSYRQASRQLNAESKATRTINNDDRIRRNVAMVANNIEKSKLKELEPVSDNMAASQLVAVVDGGHLKSNITGSRSFEAMIATVYRPENIKVIDKHHREIIKKASVGSAKSDAQVTIKQLVLNACLKEGCNDKVTQLTCLTDGASNCWSITHSLKPHCKALINVLDWFHVTKKFTIISNSASNELKENLKKVKWFLWHGNATDALERLIHLKKDIDDETLSSRLEDLYGYIQRNQSYLVNYQKRQDSKLPFTSTIAESSVNELINSRQKNNKKMQWSREGAHHILQIRASLFSKTWEQDWGISQEKIYKKAA